jgi:hypothetical protein
MNKIELYKYQKMIARMVLALAIVCSDKLLKIG